MPFNFTMLVLYPLDNFVLLQKSPCWTSLWETKTIWL